MATDNEALPALPAEPQKEYVPPPPIVPRVSPLMEAVAEIMAPTKETMGVCRQCASNEVEWAPHKLLVVCLVCEHEYSLNP